MPYQPIETPLDFGDRVRLGSPDPGREDLYLEFKSKCHNDAADQRKQAREVARDITQFSNTEGGTVLYGVEEKKDPATGIVTARGLVPLSDVNAAVKWLVGAIEKYIYPATPQPIVTPIDVGEGHVIAVNVAPAIELQGVWDRSSPNDGMEFLYRNNNKKAQMTMDQVALRMASTTRAKRLRLKALLDKTVTAGGRRCARIFHAVLTMEHGQLVTKVKVLSEDCPVLSVDDEQFALGDWRGGGASPVDVPFEYVAALWWDDHRGRPVLQLTATLDPGKLLPVWR